MKRKHKRIRKHHLKRKKMHGRGFFDWARDWGNEIVDNAKNGIRGTFHLLNKAGEAIGLPSNHSLDGTIFGGGLKEKRNLRRQLPIFHASGVPGLIHGKGLRLAGGRGLRLAGGRGLKLAGHS